MSVAAKCGCEPGTRAASRQDCRLCIAQGESIGLAIGNLRLRETLRMQSLRDPLTGLFNRRFLDETLEREAARAARWGRSRSRSASR